MEDIKLKLSFRRGEGMKRMLLIVLLVLSVGWVFAADMNIGDGDSSITGAPIDFTTTTGWSRTIYWGTDLKLTHGTEITKIKYHYDDPSYSSPMMMVPYSIYFKQVADFSYDGNEDLPNLDSYALIKSDVLMVFGAAPSMEITLNNSYFWDSTKPANLEVIWVVNNAPMPSETTPDFKSTIASGNRTLHNWKNSLTPSSHVPYVTITYTPANAVITKSSPAINEAIFTNSVTFKWEIGEGVPPSSYTLYYEKGNALSNPPENTVNIPDGNATEHTVVGLEYDKSYVWKLVPYKDGVSYAGSDQEWVFTTESILCSNMNEDFDTFPPTGWRQYTGLPDDDDELTSGEQWDDANWLNQDPSNTAAVMKYKAGTQGWLVSRAVNINPSDGNNGNDKNIVLKFDIGLTKSGASSAISNPNGQQDYRFAVYISEYPDMGIPMHRMMHGQWRNDGLGYSFNGIPHDGTTVTIPVTERGYRYIGFYAQAGFNQGAVDLFIDNVRFEEVQTDPIVNITQSELNYGYIDYDVESVRNVSIGNLGGSNLVLGQSDFVFSGTNASYFSVVSNEPESVFNEITISPGAIVQVPIYVKSMTEGEITAELTVGNNGVNRSPNNKVSLKAKTLVELGEGEIMYGRGSESKGLPLDINYTYNHSQTIIKNEEIGLKYKEITGLSFEWEGVNDAIVKIKFELFLQGTAKNNFTSQFNWVAEEFGNLVATPTVIIQPGSGRRWIDVEFDGALTYEPTEDNFIMTVISSVYNIASGDYGHFLNTNTSDYRSIRAWRNTAAYSPGMVHSSGDLERVNAIPNIKFKLRKTVDILPDEEIEIEFLEGPEGKPVISISDGAGNFIKHEETWEPQGLPNVGTGWFSFILQLFGVKPKTVRIKNPPKPWGAIDLGSGNWQTGVYDGNDIVFENIPGNGNDDDPVGFNIIFTDQNPTLPVELSHFSVTLNKENDAVIRWTTQSETGVNGFYIYRNTRDKFDNAELISSLIPATNSSNETQYSFTDKELYETGTYYYWLLVLDINGSENLTGPLTLQYNLEDGPEGVVPVVTTIKSIYPNPFNPSTTIAYSLKDKEDVSIHIYNTRGQLVYSVDRGTQDVGHYEYIWNGTSTNGTKVSSGMYFIRLKAGKTIVNKKAMLMK